jgi:hypothetical protein
VNAGLVQIDSTSICIVKYPGGAEFSGALSPRVSLPPLPGGSLRYLPLPGIGSKRGGPLRARLFVYKSKAEVCPEWSDFNQSIV